MSGEEKKERAALARQAKNLRESMGLSQAQAAIAAGVPQGTISHLESGGEVGRSYLETYLQLLQTTPREDLIATLLASGKYEKDEETGEVKRKKFVSGIGREMRAFRQKYQMTQADLSDVVHLSSSYIGQIECGASTPGEDSVRAIRRALAKYSGEEKTTKRFIPDAKDAAPKAAPAPAPKDETAPKAAPKPEAKAEPKLELIVDNGKSRRINNGENIAPLLMLDGKTMHVFTLVPGGVFVSYVDVKVS